MPRKTTSGGLSPKKAFGIGVVVLVLTAIAIFYGRGSYQAAVAGAREAGGGGVEAIIVRDGTDGATAVDTTAIREGIDGHPTKEKWIREDGSLLPGT